MRRTLSPGIFILFQPSYRGSWGRGGDVLQPQSRNLLTKIIMKDHMGLLLRR